MSASILILGSGALAREVVLAVPGAAVRLGLSELAVVVGSRDASRAEWLSLLGRARSGAVLAPARFKSLAIDWSDEDRLADAIDESSPTVILHTASLQSAWSLTQPNAWSRLVSLGGYGVTAALQAALLPCLKRALVSASYHGPLVNACYPDVINAAGPALGLKITCGLGNIALLAEVFQAHLSPANGPMRLLAGHWDVATLTRPSTERRALPPVWLGDERLADEMIRAAPALSGDVTMNALSAGATALLLCALASGRDLSTFHVPGPNGLLGGYPVRLEGGEIVLDLPKGLTLEAASAWNEERAVMDGASVVNGRTLVFSPPAAERLARVAPSLREGFDFADVEAAARAFADLRDHLRQQPPTLIY